MYLWVIGCIRQMFLKKTHVKTSNENGLDFFTLVNFLNMTKTCWMPTTWPTTWLIIIYIYDREFAFVLKDTYVHMCIFKENQHVV